MAVSETKIKDVNWKEWEREVSKLSKEDLIRFILKRSARSKRDLEKNVEIERRESTVIQAYTDLLSNLNLEDGSDDEREDQIREGKKVYDSNESKRKQIKVINEEIKEKTKKISELRVLKGEAFGKKTEAQNHITKRVMKKGHQIYSGGQNEVATSLLEAFVGCLKGKDKCTREEVLDELSNHDELMTSMNKLDEARVNKDHAKKYNEMQKKIKHLITEKENTKLIPFYVWMDNIIRIIKFITKEKEQRKEIEQKENSIFLKNHEIDQNNIILDHLGYDPLTQEHATEVTEFWNEHTEILDEDISAHEDKLDSWDQEHVQEIRSHQKKYKDEEKKYDIKLEYPVKGKSRAEKEAARAAKEKAAKEKAKAADSTTKGPRTNKNSKKSTPPVKTGLNPVEESKDGSSYSGSESGDDEGASSSSEGGSSSQDNASVSESRDEESSVMESSKQSD